MSGRWAALGVLMVGALACNAIFGIHAVEPAGGSGGEGGHGSGGDSGCQPEKPATCDAELLTDDENCCVAGRSCQGGACVDGECEEVQIATSADSEEGISVVVADDKVVWSSGYGRSIYTTSLDGGGRAVLVGPNDTQFEDVTMLAFDADAGQIYFTDYGGPGIGRVALGSGEVEQFAQIPGGAKAGLGRIVVYDGYVYVAADYQVTPAGTSGVYRAPVGAPGPLPVQMEKVADIQGAFGLAAAGGYLYYGDYDTNAIYRIGVASIGGGAPETVVDNQPSIGELALDAERIYWPVGNEIWAHALAPGGPQYQVYADDSYVWGIVADADYIWWSTVGDSAAVPGRLRRIDRGFAGPAKELYTTPVGESLAALTADCDTLYTLVREHGAVLKLSK
jgi:hypothetical protein